jgi:hypothetical protein
MGLRHAALALLHRSSEPITLGTLQVESMQVRQMNNVVGTILDRLGIHRPGSEDVSGHAQIPRNEERGGGKTTAGIDLGGPLLVPCRDSVID